MDNSSVIVLAKNSVSHDKSKVVVLPRGMEPASWEVCTIMQVEEVKILIRRLPILGSTIIMNTCFAQLYTLSAQQGNDMHQKIGMIILIPIYEFFFVPFSRKIIGHPSDITQLQCIGIGLVLFAISMAIASLVKVKRRNRALKNPLSFLGILSIWNFQNIRHVHPGRTIGFLLQ